MTSPHRYTEPACEERPPPRDLQATKLVKKQGMGEKHVHEEKQAKRETFFFPTTYLGFYDFQIPHLDAAGGEVRNLELDAYGPLALARERGRASHAATEAARHAAAVLVIAFDRGQAEFGAHEEFLPAAKLLDLPHNGRLLGRIVHGPDVCPEAWRIGVFGDGDEDLDVVGRGAALELRSCLEFHGGKF